MGLVQELITSFLNNSLFRSINSISLLCYIWLPVKIVLVSLSADSNSCEMLGLVSVDGFFFSLWLMFLCFLVYLAILGWISGIVISVFFKYWAFLSFALGCSYHAMHQFDSLGSYFYYRWFHAIPDLEQILSSPSSTVFPKLFQMVLLLT